MQHIQAQGDALAALEAVGYGENVLVFRSGLFDEVCRPIECICAAGDGGAPYTLLMDGVVASGEQGGLSVAVQEAAALPGGEARGFVAEATYFYPRDQRLMFDHTWNVTCNYTHIVEERLDRLIDAGLIDFNEARIHFGPIETAPAPVANAQWKKVDLLERLAVGVSAERLNMPSWCFQKWTVENKFVLRRNTSGLEAAKLKVERAVFEAVSVAKRNYMLAVPQVCAWCLSAVGRRTTCPCAVL